MKKLMTIFILITVTNCQGQGYSVSDFGITLKTKIACSPVQDQSMSSTCWSFASNSFIESELLKKNGINIRLSEMYIARYSYINKIKQFLAQKGQTFFTPGGQFHDVLKVARVDGMMPENVYNGKPNGEKGFDHEKLDTFMSDFSKKLLAEKRSTLTAADMLYINKALDKYMGVVPKQFIYNGHTYTPQSFMKDVLHFNPDDYIEITSYTHHPFYTKFVLEDKFNWTLDNYYNVPLDDFSAIADSALQNGYTVCWDGDVTETGFQYDNAIAYLQPEHTSLQQQRQETYEDKSTTIDHMMHIIGTATDKTNNKWYYLKNSWGVNNNIGGFMYMQDSYFKIKTVAIIVNKNAIPASIRKKMNI